MALLQFSIAVLLLPKLLGLLDTLMDQRKRSTSGGVAALIFGVMSETFFSALLAPILMLTQTRFVIDILRGKDSGWAVQNRQTYRTSLRDAKIGYYAGHTAAGLLLCLGTLLISAEVCLWLSPVWLGLILAIPIAHVTSLPVKESN
jgi:membrane glycosyltransferase